MFKEKQLMDMMRFVKRFKDECDWMATIDVELLEGALKAELYCTRVRDFYRHIKDSLPGMPDDYDSEEDYENAWDKFYTEQLVITFNGKTVSLDIDADIYDHVVTLLEDHIDDYCGGIK